MLSCRIATHTKLFISLLLQIRAPC
jgi:hypothetical protein